MDTVTIISTRLKHFDWLRKLTVIMFTQFMQIKVDTGKETFKAKLSISDLYYSLETESGEIKVAPLDQGIIFIHNVPG
jgi:hypothetical protein